MQVDDQPRSAAVAASGLTIYDDLSTRPDLVYDVYELQEHLAAHLVGRIWNYPLRTRSKVAKQAVAEALGYPVPPSFARTQPRFPGQNLDVYVQMADNLQIWNQEVDPLRRYALIRVAADGAVTAVRVVSGEALALLDNTGTLTSKFQAKRIPGSTGSKLVSKVDTERLTAVLLPVSAGDVDLRVLNPTDPPQPGLVLRIQDVYDALLDLVGKEIKDPGITRERSRGVVAQKLVTETLGFDLYADTGEFPDVPCQALEVKLQLSPTIDLGLILPSSESTAVGLGRGLAHADTRYAIAYGSRSGGGRVRIDEIVVTTGADFFTEFQRFEGLVQNRKLQIPLPVDFFDPE